MPFISLAFCSRFSIRCTTSNERTICCCCCCWWLFFSFVFIVGTINWSTLISWNFLKFHQGSKRLCISYRIRTRISELIVYICMQWVCECVCVYWKFSISGVCLCEGWSHLICIRMCLSHGISSLQVIYWFMNWKLFVEMSVPYTAQLEIPMPFDLKFYFICFDIVFCVILYRSPGGDYIDDCSTAITISFNWIRGHICHFMGHENIVFEIAHQVNQLKHF